ncbi:MAG: hypothetical protein M1319_02285 [Chloroflexi bacterium]|nr:hypothetical protein [Chloroflexota bacterium]
MATPFNVVVRQKKGKIESPEVEEKRDFITFLERASSDELRMFVGYLREKDPENCLLPLFTKLIEVTDRAERAAEAVVRRPRQ